MSAVRPRLLQRAIVSSWVVLQRSKAFPDPMQDQQEMICSRRVSVGAMLPMTRQLDRLLQILGARDGGRTAALLQARLQAHETISRANMDTIMNTVAPR